MSDSFRQVILIDDSDQFVADLTPEVTEGCSYELQRDGGCGPATIRLARAWSRRHDQPVIEVGQRIRIQSPAANGEPVPW